LPRDTIARQRGDMNDVGFPEILDDEYFYGGIVEGYKKEVETFALYKKMIDQESIDQENI